MRLGRSVARIVVMVTATLGLLVQPIAPAQAVATGPSTFEGAIGKSKVVMLIDTKTWKGAYFYLTVGRDIALSGSPGRLTEVDPNFFTNPDGKATAQFEGKLSPDGTVYSGTWKSRVNAATTAFSLKRTGNGTPGTTKRATVVAKVTTVKSEGAVDATYRLPQVDGVAPAWIGTRIAGKVSALAFSDQPLSQVIADFKPNGLGVTQVDYEVPYNDKGVLNFIVRTETEQAYPDHFENYAIFDLRNGARLMANDLWASSTKTKLVSLLQKQLNVAITESLSDPDSDLTEEMLRDSGDATINDNTLSSVTITKQGLVFTHQFNFPHAIEAAEPSGTLSLTWAEVRPYLAAGSPLTKL